MVNDSTLYNLKLGLERTSKGKFLKRTNYYLSDGDILASFENL